MIHSNGNVELQVALNEEESKWWQCRIQELGGESEIVSRNLEELEMDAIVDYLRDNGKMIGKEAVLGSELATEVHQAYVLFHKCPGDPGGLAFLDIAVNNYIRSKRFTLSMRNPDADDMWDTLRDTIHDYFYRPYFTKK